MHSRRIEMVRSATDNEENSSGNIFQANPDPRIFYDVSEPSTWSWNEERSDIEKADATWKS